MANITRYSVLALLVLFSLPIAAQDAEGGDSGGFGFTTTIGLGAATFNEVDGTQVTYNMLNFAPDISFGNFGIGLDIKLHYQTAGSFTIREEDWVPSGDKTILDLYLPIFRYIRWAQKGDPLYVKVGSIEDGTLGNGFIMRNYSNTLFLPETRIVGLAFDIDGSLFNFPYVGIETFTGNLARFDVFGTRIYVRPLSGTSLPIVKDLQIGTSFAADFFPDTVAAYLVDTPEVVVPFETLPNPEAVSMLGFDFMQPLLSADAATLALFGDLGIQTGGGNANSGGMVGFGGQLIKFINYGLNVLFLGDDFLPFYFDATYDLYREAKYRVFSGEANVPGYTGWMASLGFSFLENSLVFNASIDGSFTPDELAPVMTYPHLRGTLTVAEGLLPGFFFDAFYDKRYITGFGDLIDPTNATIGANINYKTGPAVITLGYNLRYRPEDESWETTSNLSSSISF